MTVRLPGELYEWLRREAFETREPMSVIIIAAISEYRARASARGGEIHHADGDPRNNDLGNLEVRESER
jgi:hypothetical protein